MEKRQEILETYWNYYLELEQQFLNTSKYVEICKNNFNTYSIEYLKLFQTICSEVDVLAQAIALNANQALKQNDVNTISKWGYYVEHYYPDITSFRVNIKDMIIVPFANWKHELSRNKKGALVMKLSDGSRNPNWWIEHNKVKHQRVILCKDNESFNYSKANLKNVLYSSAGLYALEMIIMSIYDIDVNQYQSHIFKSEQLVKSK